MEEGVDASLVVTLSDGAEMSITVLPAIEHMMTVMRVGNPQLGHGYYSAVGMWAEAKGFQFAGHIREVFINYASLDRIEETVTEIQIPVKPIARSFPKLN